MIKTFYIYEIVGRKVGATIQPETRNRENFNTWQIMPILIETMEGPDTPEFWQIVGDREWELADLNGYAKGTHYRIARERRINMSRSKSIKKSRSSRNNLIVNNVASLGGRVTGPKNKTNGVLQKATEAIKLTLNIEHTCPHCNKTLSGLNYRRWHGDNCKHNPNKNKII